ncbi:MAG: exodeoxyribonuclease V subunit beta [Janthinobacterium lividum]
MSVPLIPLHFPLFGSRLIEASAGTGKTWTIAALYLRLVLGHGGELAYGRALLPAEILVMTFTRAATRELSKRIRDRLVEAAACFRGEAPLVNDAFLHELIESYPHGQARQQAAHRLMLAAQTMDEAAIFTIDAWCQRMLREHAFDSGSLFDEELLSDESALFDDAVRDYWRQEVYALDREALAIWRSCWPDVKSLEKSLKALVAHAGLLGPVPEESLAVLLERLHAAQRAALAELKSGWSERAQRMEAWIAQQQARTPKTFNGNKMRAASVASWFASLQQWAGDSEAMLPEKFETAWRRLHPDGLIDACNKGSAVDVPADFEAIPLLQAALDAMEPLRFALLRAAAVSVAARLTELKRLGGNFGFADMLARLLAALRGENGAALRARIVAQYPLAMIDEFQDTSPDQYAIFDGLYRVQDNDPAHGLFLIGDPKQSIYGFRGADIHSYLAARRATEGRHYLLGTNYRSTEALVAAVNRLFLHAEGDGGADGFAGGAFRFRSQAGNPLPFEAVAAQGLAEQLVSSAGPVAALTMWCCDIDDMNKARYQATLAAHCAERIVTLLNDRHSGFRRDGVFTRVAPADIAILVRDRNEAAAIRRALQKRGLASVYLSDKDSVIASAEASDMLRWLHAVANPLDAGLGRAAFATRTANLALADLAQLASDDLAWERRIEQLKALHLVWQRQGVLAMLRRFIHQLDLPAALLARPGGERALTNLLHLAELLQQTSTQLDGEQALIRWLAEQIEHETDGGNERILRLESDADLVKVVTVHKSKGLEYPLVFLPFAVAARPANIRERSFLEFVDASGTKTIDLAMSAESLATVETARIAEDLRLLYVALTRSRHALWLGIASVKEKLHESAFGYLAAGGVAVPSASLAVALEQLRGGHDDIVIERIGAASELTLLARIDDKPALQQAARYDAEFERDWTVGSFTSLTRALGGAAPGSVSTAASTAAAPRHAQEARLVEDDDALGNEAQAAGAAARGRIAAPGTASGSDHPWHRFPRGPVPGQFLHEQFEWLAQCGFATVDDAEFEARLAARCQRAGWAHRQHDIIAWLRAAVAAPLGQAGVSLHGLQNIVPEMEFWFPSAQLETTRLDALCCQRLLDGMPRPQLPERALHGMLKGFADLIFEHQGRYWVLDYKSNALGQDDSAYHAAALAGAMAAHRYDVQGAIYLFALHRLLASRLGQSYDPASQLGGAVFLFLRGIGNQQTHGCHYLAPDSQLLAGLDLLLGSDRP